jgi:hypothetical protein
MNRGAVNRTGKIQDVYMELTMYVRWNQMMGA